MSRVHVPDKVISTHIQSLAGFVEDIDTTSVLLMTLPGYYIVMKREERGITVYLATPDHVCILYFDVIVFMNTTSQIEYTNLPPPLIGIISAYTLTFKYESKGLRLFDDIESIIRFMCHSQKLNAELPSSHIAQTSSTIIIRPVEETVHTKEGKYIPLPHRNLKMCCCYNM
jgi:hypothetical protein